MGPHQPGHEHQHEASAGDLPCEPGRPHHGYPQRAQWSATGGRGSVVSSSDSGPAREEPERCTSPDRRLSDRPFRTWSDVHSSPMWHIPTTATVSALLVFSSNRHRRVFSVP